MHKKITNAIGYGVLQVNHREGSFVRLSQVYEILSSFIEGLSP